MVQIASWCMADVCCDQVREVFAVRGKRILQFLYNRRVLKIKHSAMPGSKAAVNLGSVFAKPQAKCAASTYFYNIP